MQIIKSPWKNIFLEAVINCRYSIKIASPFVKEDAIAQLLTRKSEKVDFVLITAFELENYHRDSSDLAALERVLEGNGKVYNYHQLHAKIYIFDDVKAIISSANLTNNGLGNNYEYGILLEESSLLDCIKEDFQKLLKDEKTGRVTLEKIEEAKERIAKKEKYSPIIFEEIDFSQATELEIIEKAKEEIGKKEESSPSVFEEKDFSQATEFRSKYFELEEIYTFEDVLIPSKYSELEEIYASKGELNPSIYFESEEIYAFEDELIPSKDLKSEDNDLFTGGIESILDTLCGWNLEVFKCLTKIRSKYFELEEIYAFEDKIRKAYPENKDIEAQIRDTLQVLQNKGLIEFTSRGNYKKLWK